jgi:FAD/FMN-containing dehydrogenase
MILYLASSLSILASSCLATTGVDIKGTCVDTDPGLRWLATVLSENSTIACSGQGLSAETTDRYWAAQYAQNTSVVVFPTNSQDVSYTVQATKKTPLGRDYAFVSGGHSLTGASSSSGFLIDLKNLNRTTVLQDFPDPATRLATTVVMYEGGVTSLGLQSATNGTGWTAVSARASTVGMGGFSTGGGIGFMANAHGYAVDRLIALEVVLPSGELVFATKMNRYSDLFWAIQGGSGQFGVVTKFYQKAFRTPSAVKVGFHVVGKQSVAQSFRNTESFFRLHSDPFSLMYYALAYLPVGWPNADHDESEYRVTQLIVTLW